jgi:hypothetical protein
MFRLLAEPERRAGITAGDGHDKTARGLTRCAGGCAMGDENDPQALILARVLLGGFLKEDKRGLHQKEYLKKNSGCERERALLDRDLRDMLAALFDPKPGTHPVVERKIVFAHRTKGRRKKHEANTAIAWHVWEEVKKGLTRTAAIESAVDRYHLDVTTVKKLWGKYRRIFEKIWGPLK